MREPRVERTMLAFAAVVLVATVAGVVVYVLQDDRALASASPTAVETTHVDDAVQRLPAAEVKRELAPDLAAETSTLRVEGRVLDAAGAPAAGAAVWITWPDSLSTATDAWTIAGGDGRYALELARRAGVIRACGRDCGEGAVVLDAPADARRVELADVRLARGGTIRGRVLGVRGQALTYLDVQAWALTGPVWSTDVDGHAITAGYRECATDEEGRFALAGLRGCAHRIVLVMYGAKRRFEGASLDAVVPDGDELVLRETAVGTLHGTVIDAETRAPITAFHVDQVEHADPAGRFEVPFALDDPVFVRAEGRRTEVWVASSSASADASPEHVFELVKGVRDEEREAPRGRVVVRAVDERGVAIEDLRARNAAMRGTEGWIWGEPVQPDPVVRGRTTLPGFPRSSLRRDAVFDAVGHALVRVELERDDSVEQELELVLERGGAVELHVQDERGLEARNAALELDGARKKERWFAWKARDFTPMLARTNSAQHFAVDQPDVRIEGLPAGAYTLIVHAGEEREQSFDFVVDVETPRSYEFRLSAR